MSVGERVVVVGFSLILFVLAAFCLSGRPIKRLVVAEEDALDFVHGDHFPEDDWAAS